MKTLIIFTFIFLLLGVLACNKNEEEIEYPLWLKQKVQTMALSKELCELSTVMTIEYNHKRYYNIQMAYSSCVYCELYDESGAKKTLSETEWADFINNLKIIKSESTCHL
jgi:hypothetical protein